MSYSMTPCGQDGKGESETAMRFKNSPDYKGSYSTHAQYAEFNFITVRPIEYKAPGGKSVLLDSGTTFRGILIKGFNNTGVWVSNDVVINGRHHDCLETDGKLLKISNLSTLPETILAHVLNSASYLDAGEGIKATKAFLTQRGIRVL